MLHSLEGVSVGCRQFVKFVFRFAVWWIWYTLILNNQAWNSKTTRRQVYILVKLFLWQWNCPKVIQSYIILCISNINNILTICHLYFNCLLNQSGEIWAPCIFFFRKWQKYIFELPLNNTSSTWNFLAFAL